MTSSSVAVLDSQELRGVILHESVFPFLKGFIVV